MFYWKQMRKLIGLSFLLMICLILIVGCSKDKDDTGSPKKNPSDEATEENENTNSQSNDKQKDDNESDSEEPAEDQLGLKLGETGIVENNDKMEVTLKSASYEEEVGGIGPNDDDGIYIIVDVTIKNIGDTAFDGKNIFTPDIATDNSEEPMAYINNALDEQRDGVKLLDGELKPGDTVNGKLYFDAKKGKKYKIAFGHKSSQIVTKASWEFDDSEIK